LGEAVGAPTGKGGKDRSSTKKERWNIGSLHSVTLEMIKNDSKDKKKFKFPCARTFSLRSSWSHKTDLRRKTSFE